MLNRLLRERSLDQRGEDANDCSTMEVLIIIQDAFEVKNKSLQIPSLWQHPTWHQQTRLSINTSYTSASSYPHYYMSSDTRIFTNIQVQLYDHLICDGGVVGHPLQSLPNDFRGTLCSMTHLSESWLETWGLCKVQAIHWGSKDVGAIMDCIFLCCFC